MAIPKVCGLETEYGILVRGAENNPVTASALLINSYMASIGRQVHFDPTSETPAQDARFSLGEVAEDYDPEVEYIPVNAVLGNGARYYVDHAHPEMSTPEVRDALEAVTWDRAGDEIVARSMEVASQSLPDGVELLIHKNNSDGKGNSYGCHENYLVDRTIPFGAIIKAVMPHFVTRQVFCGAGKVGIERPGVPISTGEYQLSQRADFFEEEVGLETTVRRPIVNTRDEPHGDASRFRRLHVIAGDVNMSEVATFLKVVTTSMILATAEDLASTSFPEIARPVQAIRAVSHDPSLRSTIELADGRRARAIEVQWELYSLVERWADKFGLDAVGERAGALGLAMWSEVLADLETNPMQAADRVDWVAKMRLLGGYASRNGLHTGDLKLRAIDLQYHDLRRDRCLARRVGLKRLIDETDINAAMLIPPDSTRAYFRGRCVEKFGDAVIAANWDSLVFDLGIDPLRRVPMDDPLRGTADLVANVIDESSTVLELVQRLGA